MKKMYVILVVFILVGGVLASGCLGSGGHTSTGTHTQNSNGKNAGGSVKENGTATMSEEEIEKKVEEWMKYNYLVIHTKDAWGGDYYIVPVQTSHNLSFVYEYNITTADGVVGNVDVTVKYYKYGYLIRYNVTIYNITKFIKDNVSINELRPGITFRLGFLLKENGQLSQDYRPSPLYFSPASPENITYDNKTDTYRFVATLLFQRTLQGFSRGAWVGFGIFYNISDFGMPVSDNIYVIDTKDESIKSVELPYCEYHLVIPQDSAYNNFFKELFRKILLHKAYEQGKEYDYAVFK